MNYSDRFNIPCNTMDDKIKEITNHLNECNTCELFKGLSYDRQINFIPYIKPGIDKYITNKNNIMIESMCDNIFKLSNELADRNLDESYNDSLKSMYNIIDNILNEHSSILDSTNVDILNESMEVLEDNTKGFVVSEQQYLINECMEELIVYLNELGVSENGILDESVKTKLMYANKAKRDLAKKIDEKFRKVIAQYRENKKKYAYDKIVKNSLSLSRYVKTILASGVAGFLIHPAAAAIILIAKFACDKRTEKKYKQVILNDLKVELKIVQEKIQDASREGDNKAKIQMMRLEEELKRSIDRIVYNLPNIQ